MCAKKNESSDRHTLNTQRVFPPDRQKHQRQQQTLLFFIIMRMFFSLAQSFLLLFTFFIHFAVSAP